MKPFSSFATNQNHPLWGELIRRPNPLYSHPGEIRSEFARDYTRILHSNAYRRLKHKTQVFYNIENDHICTRMEHVGHVESVSGTIGAYLGLNTELTKAIATGHDLGHAPFGHHGEVIIRQLSKEYLGKNFWHEQNGLRMVDHLELLEDNYMIQRNLNLTYAVRDGIISHCGEVDQNGLKPRKDLIDLDEFTQPSQYQPATWEGCVVKIADKIAYIGRDIEDAISLGFLEQSDVNALLDMVKVRDERALNTSVIMHNLIMDICQNSSPEKGIRLSDNFYQQMLSVRDFNIEKIYRHDRLKPFEKYASLIIHELFDLLLNTYADGNYWSLLAKEKKHAPTLIGSFEKWLAKYCEIDTLPSAYQQYSEKYMNIKIYGKLSAKETYIQAILDYISGMTDRFAVKAFQELLSF